MSQKKRRQTQRRQTQRRQKRASRPREARRPSPARASAAGGVDRPPDVALAGSAADTGLQRWSRLLTKADKDPESVLEDPRCLKPRFIAQFFDLCDGKVLEAPWAAPDYVTAALALAEKVGDRHLINLAQH